MILANEQLAKDYVSLYCTINNSIDSVKAAQRHAKIIRDTTTPITEDYEKTGKLNVQLPDKAKQRLTSLLELGLDSAIESHLDGNRMKHRAKQRDDEHTQKEVRARYADLNLQERIHYQSLEEN